MEILLEAAANGETDRCKGVAENVMLGQLAPLGTGSFSLILDETKLKDAVPLADYTAAPNLMASDQMGFSGSGGYSPTYSWTHTASSPSINPGIEDGGAFSPSWSDAGTGSGTAGG